MKKSLLNNRRSIWLDLFNNTASIPLLVLPWAAFVFGLMGSLHCTGMCGPLVMVVGQNFKDILYYQVGRFTGYFIAAVSITFIGLKIHSNVPSIMGVQGQILSAILVGVVLIFWGVKGLSPQQKKIKPSRLHHLYQKLFGHFLKLKKNCLRSYLLGFLSILLPCGLLYAVFSLMFTLDNILQGIIIIFFFWLGTLPAMTFAPTLINKLIRPIYNQFPRFSSALLIFIGVITISYRVHLSISGLNCH